MIEFNIKIMATLFGDCHYFLERGVFLGLEQFFNYDTK